jgi:hypothetical protein
MDESEQLQLTRDVLANYTNLIQHYLLCEESVRSCKDTRTLQHYAKQIDLYLDDCDWACLPFEDIHSAILQDLRNFVKHQTGLLQKTIRGETLINKRDDDTDSEEISYG